MKTTLENQFDLWRESTPDSKTVKDALHNAEDILERLTEDEDDRLFDYISAVQRQAFYGGYRMAMQLAAECYGKDRTK